MGEYKEKIENQFWIMLCSSISDIGNKEAYRKKLEPVFKIKSKKAIKLVEAPLWSKLYSLTKEIKNPNELKTEFEAIVKIDTGKVKEHIWDILIFSGTDTRDVQSFRENFEPLFKIDSKKAVDLFKDHLWATLYSVTKKIQDPQKLSEKFEPIVQIDINRAAEAIKEVDPEKYQFLQLYK
jgi:hypothetical protein